jgi:sensor histidine kinase YesM
MMIPYLLLVFVTDAIIGYVSYTMLVSSRTEVTETGIRAAIEQTRNNAEYRMAEIRRISDQLFGSLSFQRALQKRGDRLSMYYTIIDEIFPQLQTPLELYGSPIRLTLYTLNPDIGQAGFAFSDDTITSSQYFVQSVDTLEDSAWFQSLKSTGGDNRWMQVDNDRKKGNLTHFRRLVSFADYQTVIGYIRIAVNFDSLLGNLTQYPKDRGMGLSVVDSRTGAVLFERTSDVHTAGGSDDLTLSEEIENTGFVIKVVVPKSYLNQDANRLRGLIGLICVASFAVMGLIGWTVAMLSGRRMNRIVLLIRSFQEGHLDRRLKLRGNDEFVLIAHSFNTMAASMQELVRDVYDQGVQKKQAELEALQAQINPHFLYNTLSTISSLSNLGKTQEVTGMVKGLSQFYRLTLNEGRLLIPLEKELEQVQAYLAIQKVKYADAFQAYVEMEPEVREVRIIKLLLQPFVENVFKHAWFGDTIAIRITARREGDRLELKVIDNGIGMKPEAVENILRGDAQSNAYGLKNVEERIKLRYGAEYGVTIASVFGGGTAVRLLLPLRADAFPEPGGSALSGIGSKRED